MHNTHLAKRNFAWTEFACLFLAGAFLLVTRMDDFKSDITSFPYSPFSLLGAFQFIDFFCVGNIIFFKKYIENK